jgi:hypothetical protein
VLLDDAANGLMPAKVRPTRHQRTAGIWSRAHQPEDIVYGLEIGAMIIFDPRCRKLVARRELNSNCAASAAKTGRPGACAIRMPSGKFLKSPRTIQNRLASWLAELLTMAGPRTPKHAVRSDRWRYTQRRRVLSTIF